MYTKTFYAGWSDMDFNAHMRNTAYLDKVSDLRQSYLTENGYPIEEFLRLDVGPVVLKDEIEYFKEVRLQQEISLTYALAGQAPDGSRLRLRHEILRPSGLLCARITSEVSWISLSARRFTVPPVALMVVMERLEKTDDFAVLSSSIKPAQ